VELADGPLHVEHRARHPAPRPGPAEPRVDLVERRARFRLGQRREPVARELHAIGDVGAQGPGLLERVVTAMAHPSPA